MNNYLINNNTHYLIHTAPCGLIIGRNRFSGSWDSMIDYLTTEEYNELEILIDNINKEE